MYWNFSNSGAPPPTYWLDEQFNYSGVPNPVIWTIERGSPTVNGTNLVLPGAATPNNGIIYTNATMGVNPGFHAKWYAKYGQTSYYSYFQFRGTINPNNQIRLRKGLASGEYNFRTISPSGNTVSTFYIADNNFHLFEIVYDETLREAKIYVDSILKITHSVGLGDWMPQTSWVPLLRLIGNGYSTYENFLIDYITVELT